MSSSGAMEKLAALNELIELDNAGCMNEWERGFISKKHSFFKRNYLKISEKEEAVINRIYKAAFDEGGDDA